MSLSSSKENGHDTQDQLTFKVGGMDCGSCAATIETALKRLPGVSSINVSVAREMMKLSLDEQQTSVGKIEETVRKLGYKPAFVPRPSEPHADDDHHEHGPGCSHDHHDNSHDHGDHDHGSHDHTRNHKDEKSAALDHTHGAEEPGVWWKGEKSRNTLFAAVLLGG